MKNLVVLIAGLVVLTVALLVVRSHWRQRVDPQTAEFLADAEQLAKALQEYRKFVGAFPSGSGVDIANALSGQSDSNKKVLVLASSLKKRNPQGEITDPWGSAVQFFFSAGTVLIRSAGPNRAFEDSSHPATDDLFFADTK
jgi:hypothetical protein